MSYFVFHFKFVGHGAVYTERTFSILIIIAYFLLKLAQLFKAIFNYLLRNTLIHNFSRHSKRVKVAAKITERKYGPRIL